MHAICLIIITFLAVWIMYLANAKREADSNARFWRTCSQDNGLTAAKYAGKIMNIHRFLHDEGFIKSSSDYDPVEAITQLVQELRKENEALREQID